MADKLLKGVIVINDALISIFLSPLLGIDTDEVAMACFGLVCGGVALVLGFMWLTGQFKREPTYTLFTHCRCECGQKLPRSTKLSHEAFINADHEKAYEDRMQDEADIWLQYDPIEHGDGYE